jgi:hypothetical protein
LVEIKAYVDDQARAKINQCPESVKLITYGEIEMYIEYAKKKNSDLTKLYEGVNPASSRGLSDKQV